MILTIALWGCASTIRADFDAARDAALAGPPPLAADWSPDLEVQLAPDAVGDLLAALTDDVGTLKTTRTVGPASVTPRLTVDRLALKPQRGGDDLLLDVSLSGKVRWKAGPLDGKLPVQVDAVAATAVEATRQGDEWVPTLTLTRITDLTVDIDGAIAGVSGLDDEVQSWLDKALTEVPPLPLPPVGGDDLPLRALRVQQAGKGLRLLGKTEANVDGVVQRPQGMPSTGFRVALAEESLLALVRAEAFRQGPVGYDIVGEPRSLGFTDEGFELGLRLWRPVGAGWWRDYDVTGTATVKPRRIQLAAAEVQEGAKSKGAAFADPLAALGEGLILRTLEDALVAAVPATAEAKLGDTVLDVQLQGVAPGPGRAVVVQGSLQTE